MSLRDGMARAIRAAGGTAFLLDGVGEEIPFAASVQPVLDHSPGEDTVLGWGPDARAVLYAPCGGVPDRLEAGSRIRWRDKIYRVLRAEALAAAGQDVYVWAALQREAGGGA